MDTDKKAPPVYQRSTKPLGVLEPFEVALPGGTAIFTGRNVSLAEFHGLDDFLIGEKLEGADTTGQKRLAGRILKLEQVITRIENIDPADLEATGGEVGQILRLRGNEDMAWIGWDRYVDALAGSRSKSSPVVDGGRDGEGGAPEGEGCEAAASVSDLRGAAATAD
jgi:hypothetical protein